MTVHEVLSAVGNWDLNLKDTIPRALYEQNINYFGHIAITPGRVDPVQLGDNMLSVARYVGVVRRKSSGDTFTLGGGGMVLWLGDEDDKGNVFENATTFVTASFANTIRGLLPPAITEGTLHSVAGTYTGSHQWQTPRAAIQYVCDTFNAEFRINNNGTIDAGIPSDLFVTTPTALIVRQGAGHDPTLAGLPGKFETDQDVEDYTTRVVLLAQGDNGSSLYTGSADISPALNPYKDVHGNTVVRTRLVSESDTSAGNATVRAQLQLNRFTSTRKALTLSATEYDIKGEFNVGDTIWVYDPDAGLYNVVNEIRYRAQPINPIALRVRETAWPITEGMTVAYRAGDGTWYNLTDYVEFETGDTSVVVGDFSKSLTSSGFQDPGTRVSSDTSVPAAPAFTTPFTSAVYLDLKGFTKANMTVKWSAPINKDGSTIQDGDHFEIQYTVDTDHIYPQRWANLETIQWNNLGEWGQPFVWPDGGEWNVAYAPWGSTTILVNELATGVGYRFRIRAVDKSGNEGDWSAIYTQTTNQDNIPPSQPTPPTVAGSVIAIQVSHNLGTTSGGDWTLENDIDHLNVHVGTGQDFYVDEASLVGRLRANSGMVQAQIPAVGTFKIDNTVGVWVKVVAVDIAGNKSVGSDSAQVSAILVDDAHISDLSVSKVTAGTINADFVVGARIKTADSGVRVELNSSGFQAYDNAGSQTVNISAVDGSANLVGTITSGNSGGRLVVNPIIGANPEIRFYVDATANYHYITTDLSNSIQLLMNSNDAVDTNPGFSGVLDLAGDRVLMGLKNNTDHITTPNISIKPSSDQGVTIDGDGVVQIFANAGTFSVFASQTIFNVAHQTIDTANAVVGGDPSIYSGLQFLASGNVISQGFRANWTGTALQFARNDTNTVVKTFIIDHPKDSNKYLIHATTESPHNGVEYWGTAQLDKYGHAVVDLPKYFEELTAKQGRAVLLTPVRGVSAVSATDIEDGSFRIRGRAGSSVSWLVKAIRKDVPPLLVEPLKRDLDVYGDGPYKYYVPGGK